MNTTSPLRIMTALNLDALAREIGDTYARANGFGGGRIAEEVAAYALGVLRRHCPAPSPVVKSEDEGDTSKITRYVLPTDRIAVTRETMETLRFFHGIKRAYVSRDTYERHVSVLDAFKNRCDVAGDDV